MVRERGEGEIHKVRKKRKLTEAAGYRQGCRERSGLVTRPQEGGGRRGEAQELQGRGRVSDETDMRKPPHPQLKYSLVANKLWTNVLFCFFLCLS